MKTTPCRFSALLFALALLVVPSWAQSIITPAAQPAAAIPFDQLGAAAQKQYAGDGISITPTADGARLRAVFQKLEGEATREGLWLTSTAEEDAGKGEKFRVMASAIGRVGSQLSTLNSQLLPATGTVQTTAEAAVFLRPGLIEEYRVSMDGVRQDFIILERPAGAGELSVELALSGATAETASYGARLTLAGSGRAIAYSRLRVSDATGRELAAALEVVAADRLAVRVDDATAAYPIRIDPTFSDADWVSLNPGIPGANGSVNAIAVDGSGNVYVGGYFTFIGTVAANYIAKWNGSAWSALGSGMNNQVVALAVSGSDLYAGGKFTTVGGVSASNIAKWNGSVWSALGSGTGGNFPYIYALAVSGSDLYAGGLFTTAGGVTVNHIAKWNGSAWSALGSGVDSRVSVMAVSGSDLYAAGFFGTAGGVTVNYIAKWNGSAWSALGSGMDNTVSALAVSGSDLYVGGYFATAGGVSASNVAKWNGSVWSALGAGMDNNVFALAVSGSDLYAGGSFGTAGGVSANYLAKWNGSAWSALGSGMDGFVNALTADASGHLFVGGSFYFAGMTVSPFIAQANIGGAAPEIAVEQPAGTDLASGTASIAFGTVTLGSSSAAKTFTIKNTGTGALTITSVGATGGNAGDFPVNTAGMLTSVPATNGSTTFSVTFTPAAAGPRATTLRILNDDSNEGTFDIALSGTALTAQEAWRLQYFGTTSNTGNAADAADPDGDGQTNLFEYVAGLAPTDATSRFTLTIAAVPGQPTQKALSFTPVVAGRTYTITSKSTLTAPTWSAITASAPSDNGTTRTITDLSATPAPKFYHVEITKP